MIFTLVFSCSTKELEKTAQELVTDGTKAYNEEEFKQSIASFKKLKDWYPFSKHVIVAERRIADANFMLENYREAILSYEEFEKLHPKNALIPYIIYQKGLCHYFQIDTIDRDQRNAASALNIFNRLLKEYPNGEYAEKASKKRQKCINSLAGHEFYVGVFYYKSKHFKGALKRFEFLMNTYPDTEYKAKAEHYIKLCQKNMK
ncbi:MAG: outer membrane protein assembly factor BamD [Proteobacteria bacterium]|nr:outer membrane protein assembly factor BamD [Pseudomonadota bacterium]